MPGNDGEPEERDTDPSGTSISPYLPPKRRSILPKDPGTHIYPSGVVARPVEEYLVHEEASGETSPNSGGPELPSTPSVQPARGDGDGGGGSDFRGGLFSRLPRGAIVGGVIVAAFGLGIGIMAVAGGPGPNPSPSPSGTLQPAPNPTLVSYFDDGIAAQEYPSAATWRGEGYPGARQIEDWVWDRTGPGWALVLFAESRSTNTSGTLSVPVVYLVSPEGVYFELADLPGKVADGPRLVSWIESERKARIVWNYASQGGRADLTSGGVEDATFTVNSIQTNSVQFLAANAAGTEVWMARSEDGLSYRFELWPGKSPWDHILDGQGDLYLETRTSPSNPDDSMIALQVCSIEDVTCASSRAGPIGEPRLVVYSLDTGEDRFIRPEIPFTNPSCTYIGWIDTSSVGYACWDPATSRQNDFQVFVDGTDRIVPYEWVDPWWSELAMTGSVRDPNAPLELVSNPDGGLLTAVRLLMESGTVSLITEEADLGSKGREISSLDEVATGIYRLVTVDGIVIGIDTRTATTGTTIPAVDPNGAPLLPHSYVFFGESTPQGAGIVGGE